MSGSEKIITAKNGRKMMKCKCAKCGITKTKFIKGNQKGGDLFDSAVGTATNLFVEHALPYKAKKSVEMARCYGSEALRNKNLQIKAINYGLIKLTPIIQNVGSEALDQLSTKIRQNKNYKTDRKDLDGGSIQLLEKVNDILRDPKKYKKYQYAWEQEHWGNS